MFASNRDRIEHNNTLHPPLSPAVGALMDELRSAAKEWQHAVDRLVPDSREKSQALTDSEDALMHAIAGLARNQHLIPLNESAGT